MGRPAGARIGYERVSTADQNLDLQHDALVAADCTRIFTERASGASADRPQLAALLDYARPGDQVVVWRLDRLARSVRDLVDLAARLEAGGVQLQSLQEQLDTASAGPGRRRSQGRRDFGGDCCVNPLTPSPESDIIVLLEGSTRLNLPARKATP